MNDSAGSPAVVSLGDGVGVGCELVVDSEGVTVVGGAAMGTAPQPANAVGIISAQVAIHAR